MEEAKLEEDWVRLAQRGDQEAFRQLVLRYGPLTERLARVLLPDRATAEDAVQEAWLDVWRGLPSFEAGRPLRPWLLTVVANRCRMTARKRQWSSLPLDHQQSEALVGAGDPGEAALQAEDEAEVRAALAELREDQQQMLALRFFAELELAEIARLTGRPVGTVKSRLHRALASLRERLSALAGGE